MRRYGAKVSVYIYEKLQELLDQGLIVPCQAIAAANVVVVQQKDKLRFCIDYRWINDQSENLQYPIPHLRDLLQFLHGKKIFSVLDNKLGYHQLTVDEQSRYLLAFQTQFGMFMWTRCPFGHKTLPPWYNFLMATIVFAGLLYRLLVCYFDDAVVGSNSHDEHLQHLAIVFARYEKHDMILRGSKCQVAQDSIAFHGHIISAHTITHDPKRCQQVFEIPRPMTTKKLQMFLGLVNYFSFYIPNYSMLRKPLNLVMSKKKFEYTNQAIHAFEMLRQAIRDIRKLYHIDHSLPIFLAVDASIVGIGAYLY